MTASLFARRRSTRDKSARPEILTCLRSMQLILPSALMALLMNTKGLFNRVKLASPFLMWAKRS
jgi:hypothetical protein